MMVLIDPNELSAVAKTLEQCANEVADIGAQLSACVSCPMPPAVAGDVGALIAKADALLDRTGVVFTEQAIGLVGRAIIAVLDSLAAATGVAPLSTMGVIGGAPMSGVTITNIDGSPAVGLNEMGGFVGGGSIPSGVTITNIDGSPAVGLNEVSIGGSWSPDQGTDYPSSPSGVSIPTPLGSSGPTPRTTPNQRFIDNITAQTLNGPVLRDIYQTRQMIKRDSTISSLPPVERHQLPV